jgi:hypothetical protein
LSGSVTRCRKGQAGRGKDSKRRKFQEKELSARGRASRLGAKSTNSALLSALGGDSELPTTDNATTNLLDNNKKYITIYLD